TGLKGAVEHCGTPMYCLNVEDPGIIHDADTPEDYAELLRAHNQSLIRSEIQIQLAREKVFFDEQLYSLLTLIHETGSVRDACERMHISYSTSWNLIHTLESQLHEPLIIRSQGGVKGSHSELTPYGEEFLKRYARFSEETRTCSEAIFEKCFRGFFNA
ncbi:MAG: LysR family transcriptional regulator, partial [Blautia wexlerae]